MLRRVRARSPSESLVEVLFGLSISDTPWTTLSAHSLLDEYIKLKGFTPSLVPTPIRYANLLTLTEVTVYCAGIEMFQSHSASMWRFRATPAQRTT
jgi:hypothetical protein